MRLPRAVGILCGGGPTPGINSVIGAATIRAELAGVSVVGIRDGFKVLVDGKPETCTRLTIGDVSRIHFSGGSYLGTSPRQPVA
jgi:6-phosphofructokinase